MIKIVRGSVFLLLAFSLAGANPPREVPSVMTLQQMDTYLSGGAVDEILPAEAFGYPSPVKVLRLEKELDLTAEQKKRMEFILGALNSEATVFGKKIVADELQLDDFFRKDQADYAQVSNLIERIGGWRWRMRLAYLGAYVKTRMALNSDQVRRYRELRSTVTEEKSSGQP